MATKYCAFSSFWVEYCHYCERMLVVDYVGYLSLLDKECVVVETVDTVVVSVNYCNVSNNLHEQDE